MPAAHELCKTCTQIIKRIKARVKYTGKLDFPVEFAKVGRNVQKRAEELKNRRVATNTSPNTFTSSCWFMCCSGVRPFGVSLLLAGWDEDGGKPFLYQCDPSVSQHWLC